MDLAPRIRDGLGALEQARVRDNAQKGEEAWPRQTDRPAAIQLRVKPPARLRMLRKGADVGVDWQVGVEQDHRNDLLSATASTSATCRLGPCDPLRRKSSSVYKRDRRTQQSQEQQQKEKRGHARTIEEAFGQPGQQKPAKGCQKGRGE